MTSLIAALELPPPHLLEPGKRNRFRGMALDPSGRTIDRVRVTIDGAPAGEFPANRPSEDLAGFLPSLPAARNCRFDFELEVPSTAGRLEFFASAEPLFDYDLGSVGELRRLTPAIEALPAPPPEIVAVTQGHRDVAGYRNSILPGVWNMRRYLAEAGVKRVTRVLDFGCGSGRLLTGWLINRSAETLTGCDPNEALTRWASENLPSEVRIDRTSPLPPLPYSDAGFDFVYAASVFTHLRFPTQRLWAKELARVVEPGGTLLVTLHGPSFVELFAPARLDQFRRDGHVETDGAEGSNELASFHSPGAVDALFEGFERIGYFPEGRIAGKRMIFPIAGMQDVYVLRRLSSG